MSAADEPKSFRPSWNWEAMFFTFPWLYSRKMYVHAWAYFVVSTPVLVFVLLHTPVDSCATMLGGYWNTPAAIVRDAILGLLLLGFVLPPLISDRLHARFLAQSIAAAERAPDEETGQRRLRLRTGTRSQLGPTLLLLGVLAAAVSSSTPHNYTTRFRVSEVLLAASRYRTAASEFFEAHKRLPAKIEEVGGFRGPDRTMQAVTLEKEGTIRVIAALAPLQGRSILLTPRIRDGKLEWSCGSDDIPNRCLPGSCRGG